MTQFNMKDVQDTPYLYVERTCSMDPRDISQNMDIAFAKVAEFVAAHQITSMRNSLSVYYTHDDKKMTFRAGFIVSAEDTQRAAGEVRGDRLPAGRVLNFIHRGPYAKLRDSYAEMMSYLESESLSISAPTAEIYLNDPSSVASEDELETDIYVAVKAA